MTILQKISSKTILQVLTAYIQTWQVQDDNNQTPNITLYLKQGSEVFGEVVDINFEDKKLCLSVLNVKKQLDVSFVSWESIEAFTLHSLDLCPIFVEELAKT